MKWFKRVKYEKPPRKMCRNCYKEYESKMDFCSWDCEDNWQYIGNERKCVDCNSWVDISTLIWDSSLSPNHRCPTCWDSRQQAALEKAEREFEEYRAQLIRKLTGAP